MTDVILETGIVVIGSGATGMAAALTAAQGGAKVILFEKQRSLGGTSNFFEGTFAVESVMQRERYIMYSCDQAFKNLMEYSHWRANPRLVRAFVNESAETISWLIDQGVEFIDATINMPDAPRTYHMIKGYGEALIKALALKAKEKGVDVRLGTPVTKILREGEKITGVIAEGDDGEIQVKCKAVIIGSGGYANNKEWIKKYNGFDLGINLQPIGNTDKMGDGIRMAWEIGAAEVGMEVLELFRIGPVGPQFSTKGAVEFPTVQPDLWVDPTGQRFCDEGIAFYDSSVGNVNAKHKEGYTFSIFDDSIIKRIHERGIDRNVASENLPGAKPVNFEKELKNALEKGPDDVFIADSVEELAEKIGVEPALLRATIDEYNSFCAKGHDDLFAKDRKYLWPLTGPRFYAVKARTVFLGTKGGIKVNEKLEVVDKKGKVIPGLYAGGYDAGGMYGDSYPINIASGATQLPARSSAGVPGTPSS
ncbi:MAG: FAD-dependent oxidoreductase [Dehalococcoidia bacterium]